MREEKSIVIAAILYIVLIIAIAIVGNYFWTDIPKPGVVHEIDTIHVPIIDTIDNTNYRIVDSLKSEILIRDLKLERIREYNKIAAKGNNIKYLRGWINRVLEE